MKVFILSILFTTILLSQENTFDALLDKYRNSKELYLQTKKESAGHITVYSRSDLDRMQAYTLNDILKTLRIFNVQIDSVGRQTLIKSGANALTNNPIKIYIDSHELNSATLGNPLAQYGKMGLYFIDHIEIYQGANPVSFGNEPASIIIKLYTKDPSRENATSAQISVDTKSSTEFRIIDARVFDDYSYLINLDASKNNFKKYNTNGYELSRDGARGQLYFKFTKKDDYNINIGATKEKYDSFKGFGQAPLGGNINTENAYIQFIKYFDNDIKLTTSASTESLFTQMSDENGTTLPNGITSQDIAGKVTTNVYNISLKKKYTKENNDLLIGVHIKEKHFNIKKLKFNNISYPTHTQLDKINIYMAFFENLYNYDENNLITLSAEIDRYENNFSTSSTEYTYRAGYVGIYDKKWTFKIFGLKSYDYPIFRQTTFSPTYKVNPYLTSASTTSITSEIIYKTDNTITNFSYGGGTKKNAIVFSKTQNKYINKTGKNRFTRAYIRTEYNFNANNKIMIEYYKLFKETYASSGYGGLVQIFNKIGKFDIYNELIYRSGYTSIDKIDMPSSYNYSLGVTYRLNKKTEIKLKGENLLDKSLEVPLNGANVASSERKGILSLEYTF